MKTRQDISLYVLGLRKIEQSEIKSCKEQRPPGLTRVKVFSYAKIFHVFVVSKDNEGFRTPPPANVSTLRGPALWPTTPSHQRHNSSLLVIKAERKNHMAGLCDLSLTLGKELHPHDLRRIHSDNEVSVGIRHGEDKRRDEQVFEFCKSLCSSGRLVKCTFRKGDNMHRTGNLTATFYETSVKFANAKSRCNCFLELGAGQFSTASFFLGSIKILSLATRSQKNDIVGV